MQSILARRPLASAVAALAISANMSGAARAAPAEWDFTYTFLCDFYVSCADFKGSFVADDLDHDGHIGLDELIGLQFDNVYFSVAETQSFQYTSADNLSFTALSSGNKPGAYVETGQVYRPGGDSTVEWVWNRYTTQSVVAAVPEASTWACLMLGLVALTGWARRGPRRFRTPPASTTPATTATSA